MTATSVPPGEIPYLARLCMGTEQNPHSASSVELRLSSRISDSTELC